MQPGRAAAGCLYPPPALGPIRVYSVGDMSLWRLVRPGARAGKVNHIYTPTGRSDFDTAKRCPSLQTQGRVRPSSFE